MSKAVTIVAYARVSTREQSLDSHALEQQVERLRLTGATQIFVDIESGYKGRIRPELDKLMQLVRSRQVSEVLVTRLDRLSRKGKQAFALFDDFIESGVILRVLDEPIDLSTSAGKMAAGMLAVMAQHHSDQKSEAVQHGWQHLRKRKVAMNPPFGYCKVSDHHQLDNKPFVCLLNIKEERSRSDVAREIVSAFFQAQTLRGCLRIINERYGIQTFAHHHKAGGLFARGLFRFSPGGLQNWLTSPVLRGHTCYLRKKNGQRQTQDKWDIHHNTHSDDALITDLQLREIEQILAHNRQVRGYGCTGQKYPLSGLVFCGECRNSCYSLKGGRGKNQPGYNYYFQCKNWRVRSCNQKSVVRMEIMEEAVISALTAKSREITTYADIPTPTVEPQELMQLRSRLTALSGLGYDPDIEEAKTKLQRRINEFIHGLGQHQQETDSRIDMLRSFPDPLYWFTLPDNEKRVIFRALIEKVVIKDGAVVEVLLKI